MVGRVTRSQSKKTDEPAAATPAKKEEKPTPVKAKKTPAKKKEAAPAKPKSPAKAKGGKKGAKKKEEEPEETKDVETEEAEKKEEETEEKEEEGEKKEEKEAEEKEEKEEDKKKVEVEACKQWGAFKTRAEKIRKAVGDKAKVEINVVKVNTYVLYLGTLGWLSFGLLMFIGFYVISSWYLYCSRAREISLWKLVGVRNQL